MDKEGTGNVKKEDVCNYVTKSPEMGELYGIDFKNLSYNLKVFPSKNHNYLSFEEFLLFLQTTRILPGTKAENICLLNQETLDIFKEIFFKLDKYEDLIVKRETLVSEIKKDIRIKPLLNKVAVHVGEVDKHLLLESLLSQIEEEAKGEQNKNKEYISLTQFLKYFTNYQTPKSLCLCENRETKRSNNFHKEENNFDLLEITPEIQRFLRQNFDTLLEKNSTLVETIFLIDKLRSEELYDVYKKAFARRKCLESGLGDETVEEVLNRMEFEANKYLCWSEFIAYFTRRGKLKESWNEVEENQPSLNDEEEDLNENNHESEEDEDEDEEDIINPQNSQERVQTENTPNRGSKSIIFLIQFNKEEEGGENIE